MNPGASETQLNKLPHLLFAVSLFQILMKTKDLVQAVSKHVGIPSVYKTADILIF